MRIINRELAVELLPMKDCIELMEKVLADLSAGLAVQSLRTVLPLPGSGLIGLMPGYLPEEKTAGAKIISVFPDNHKKGLPSHQGAIALFDMENGQIKAVIDGQGITAVRTAAASAVATRSLAGAGAETLAIIGTGEQANSHLEAMLLVRPIRKVYVWSPTTAHARGFAEDMSRRFGVPVEAAGSVQEAVMDADIVCTVTASATPVLKGEWLKEGVHINAVGACRAPDRELDTTCVQRASLFVDRLESAVHEAGDYLIPLAEQAIAPQHIKAEIGAVFSGAAPGRQTAEEITLFKSLGLAVEDLAAACHIYEEAVRTGAGIEAPF